VNKRRFRDCRLKVGRLDPSTTADDLKQYLDEVGIKDADCWKIQARDGRVF